MNTFRSISAPEQRSPWLRTNASSNGLAVDGAGDLFIADSGNGRVVEVPAGGGSQVILPVTGLIGPCRVAVDGAGDVFIGDYESSLVVEVPAGGGASITLASYPTVSQPCGVAVDGAGDVFIADYNDGRVAEIPAGSSSPITVPVSGLIVPWGVVVDGAGDLFVTDYFSNKVLEVPAGGGTPTILLSYPAVYEPNAVAVDGTGNVFVASAQEPSGVLEVNRGQPPSLSFASTQLGKTSSDSPKSVTVQNIGNPPLDAVSPGLVVSGPNFVQVVGTGTPADCGTGFSASPLAPGGICNLSINFEPQTGGMLTSTAVFTDNALNTSPSATQSISLQGTGAGNGTPPQITSANSATFIVGTSNLFTVTTTGTPTPSLSENGTLPFGVSFLDDGDGTGTLCGTPTVSGIFNISFTAHNAVVPDAIQSFTLTVDQAPAITSGNNTAFILGTGGTFSVTASGFPTPTVTESGALPNGVTFTGGSGSGMLSGTPTQSGMFNITL